MLVVIFSVVVAAVIFSVNVNARFVFNVADVVVVVAGAVAPFDGMADITVGVIVING